jgi:hypothetical protein
MKNKHYLTLMILSLILGYFVLKTYDYRDKNITVRYPKRKDVQEQVRYLKDSFNNEYYKKQLETYPFEHSKINNER